MGLRDLLRSRLGVQKRKELRVLSKVLEKALEVLSSSLVQVSGGYSLLFIHD